MNFINTFAAILAADEARKRQTIAKIARQPHILVVDDPAQGCIIVRPTVDEDLEPTCGAAIRRFPRTDRGKKAAKSYAVRAAAALGIGWSCNF